MVGQRFTTIEPSPYKLGSRVTKPLYEEETTWKRLYIKDVQA